MGDTSEPAQVPQIAPDPALAAEQQQAQQELIKNLQTQAAGDTAEIMARYGTRVALAVTAITGSAAMPNIGARAA